MLGVGIGVLIRSQIGATVTGILLYLWRCGRRGDRDGLLAGRLGDSINELQLLVPSLAVLARIITDGRRPDSGQPAPLGGFVRSGPMIGVVTGAVGFVAGAIGTTHDHAAAGDSLLDPTRSPAGPAPA